MRYPALVSASILAAAALAAVSAPAIAQTTSDKIERKTDRAIDKTKDAAHDAADKTKDTAKDVSDKTKDAAHDAADKTKDAARDVKDKTKDVAHDTKDSISHKTEKASDKSKNIASEAKSVASDSWITSKAKIALFSDDRVKGRQVHVETTNGTIYLRGKVDSADAKSAAGEIAKGIDGVRSVKNELQVVAPAAMKEVSATDDEITKAVKDRLSRDSQLKGIDVRTDAGVVALSGDVDRIGGSARASELARGVPGVRSVKNDIKYKDEDRTAAAHDTAARSDRHAARSAGTAMQDGSLDNVRMVQQALKENGYDPGPIDGVQGPQTTAALRAYQKAEGMTVTGRVDSDTLGKLGVGASGATAGSTSSATKKQSP